MAAPSASDKIQPSPEDDYARGVADAALAFTDLVDDCDRALIALVEMDAPEAIISGLEKSRERMLAEFTKFGFESLAPLNADFDPLFHEAISTEPGSGKDNVIVRVHRRGWMQKGKLLRPALVTVRQGLPGVEQDEEEQESTTDVFEAPHDNAEIAFPRRRRRSHAGTDFFGGR